MNHKARLLPILIVSALCMRCLTPQQDAGLGRTPLITAHCAYVNAKRSLSRSEVECTLENMGDKPARIRFTKASLDDPSAEIQPVDIKRLRKQEFPEDAVVVLGIIFVIGVLVALAARSRTQYVPRVHVHIPLSAARPPAPTVMNLSSTEKGSIHDTFAIPGQRSATLLFSIQYEQKKPQTLILEFDDGEARTLRVPIEAVFGPSKGRSNFDY